MAVIIPNWLKFLFIVGGCGVALMLAYVAFIVAPEHFHRKKVVKLEVKVAALIERRTKIKDEISRLEFAKCQKLMESGNVKHAIKQEIERLRDEDLLDNAIELGVTRIKLRQVREWLDNSR